MNRPRRRHLAALVTTVGLAVFYRWGRPIWQPARTRIAGQKTVSVVLSDLEPKLRSRFPGLNDLTDGGEIALLAFKEERRLEVWKNHPAGPELVRTYPFTGSSGGPGPKLREGDLQIPEGIYNIEYLNPNSSYHLSIKLDYPNAFDREMAAHDRRSGLGFDIFIHGGSSTVGCIPIGDTNIEEVFYLVAKNGKANTRVIIAPYDLTRVPRPPEIPSITWENELYEQVSAALGPYRRPLEKPPGSR